MPKHEFFCIPVNSSMWPCSLEEIEDNLELKGHTSLETLYAITETSLLDPQ